MMHCLWITRQDPRPADSGELIYSLGLLRALAGEGDTTITVLAHRGRETDDRIDRVRWILPAPIPSKSPLGLISPLPLDAHRLGGRTMRRALAELLATETFDRVVIDQAACGWALDMLPADLPLAYIAHNHEAAVRAEVADDATGALRPVFLRDARKYAALEHAVADRAGLVTAITPRDERAFRRGFPAKPTLRLTPGHDGAVPDEIPPITNETPRRVVLGGAFEWVAKRRNLEAFLQAAARPFQESEIQFHVVGKADPAYFQQLGRRFPWARFTANVPDMEPHLRDARLGLIPEAIGGGFKLKALDYIFRGLPLAAINSALSGLPLEPDETALAADTPESLATLIATRIDDLDFLNHAARGALEACRHAFAWRDRGAALARALHDMGSTR